MINLDKYAELALVVGVNLKKGDELYITCEVEEYEYGRAIAKKAYEMGAKKVIVVYADSLLTREYFTNASTETIEAIPEWQAMMKNSVAVNKACNIYIVSQDPDYLSGVATEKLIAYTRAANKAFKAYREGAMNNEFRWLVYSAPGKKWAQKVFPELPIDKAVEKLGEMIAKATLLDTPDPVLSWRKKINDMSRHAKLLTDADIVSFHYKNEAGTDFTIGMPDKYYFSAAEENSVDGVPFTANLPTEEVFSAPDYRTANGTLVAGKPLIYNGNVIENFSLTFKDGKVVSFTAEKGYDTLKSLVNMDEGSCYLGEIALVPYSSAISQTKTLFFETLYDENASCHFALGDSYPLVKDASELTKEERKERGLNSSGVHSDFMVGTKDLSIIATKRNGDKLVVFENGDFAF